MLRATRDLSPASAFLGDDDQPGEFEAVAMLLAMVTADGYLSRHVLDARPTDNPGVAGGLAWRPAAGPRWSEFAAGLAPRQAGETWENQIIGQIPARDLGAWQRLAAAVSQTQGLVRLADLSAFQRWAPRIRRFSYLVSQQRPEQPRA